MMAKKTEVHKLTGWLKGNRELVDPPRPEQHRENLREPEVTAPCDEPEEQYNIRIARSLKRRLKLLVVEEGKPMGVLLGQMLELYLQHRVRRSQRSERVGS